MFSSGEGLPLLGMNPIQGWRGGWNRVWADAEVEQKGGGRREARKWFDDCDWQKQLVLVQNVAADKKKKVKNMEMLKGVLEREVFLERAE